MNKVLCVLSFALLTISCGQAKQNNSGDKNISAIPRSNPIEQQDTEIVNKSRVNLKSAQPWTDSLIGYYISNSLNERIKFARKNKISEDWLFDQTINADTAKYFVFQIGHDESDEGKTNLRFVTDQWVYIDSATKRLYEYDIINDSLISWTQ